MKKYIPWESVRTSPLFERQRTAVVTSWCQRRRQTTVLCKHILWNQTLYLQQPSDVSHPSCIIKTKTCPFHHLHQSVKKKERKYLQYKLARHQSSKQPHKSFDTGMQRLTPHPLFSTTCELYKLNNYAHHWWYLQPILFVISDWNKNAAIMYKNWFVGSVTDCRLERRLSDHGQQSCNNMTACSLPGIFFIS